jgi:putative ABC transport system permease protein
MMVRVALRNVMRHRLRTAFTVAALAIAVALLADMLMLSNGMEKTFYRVLSSVGYEVRVCPWGTLPFSTDAAIAESSRVVRALDDEPHVERWLRVLGTTLYSDSTSLFAMGIDGSEQSLYTVTGGVDLNAAPADDRANVVLNENAAEALGVDVGDEIELRTGVTSDRTAFVVVGIIALAFDLPQQRTIVMPMDVVYHLRPEMRDAASFVLVKLKTPASPSNSFAPLDDQRAVAASLAAEFPELSVYSLDQLMEALQGQLAYFKQFALVLSTISVFITFLLIAVVLTIGVGERRGEIAALRSMGFRRASIRGMVLAESAILLAMGAVAGSILGWILAGRLDRILTQSPSLPAGYRFFIPEPREIAIAVVITAVAGAIAALLPAVFAARIDIPRTLHEEVV